MGEKLEPKPNLELLQSSKFDFDSNSTLEKGTNIDTRTTTKETTESGTRTKTGPGQYINEDKNTKQTSKSEIGTKTRSRTFTKF